MLRLLLCLSVVCLAAGPPESSPATVAARYTLSFPEPHTHYVEVEARFPSGGASTLELRMAVWTPGSYLVREFARNVENLSAVDESGKPRALEKSRKNRWQIETSGAREVILRYRVYCREMSVRTNWVEEDFAVLNGGPTFISPVGAQAGPHEVTFELPSPWKTTSTGLPRHPDGSPHHYLAPDYDTLVDCPTVCGNPAIHEFEVAGKKHTLVNQGEGGVWDGPRSAADVKKIVEAHLALWRQLPYDEYTFLNLITESGGGLEHRNSTLMMTSRWRTGVPKDYRGWLGLVSHEFFHTWNVKRLRPASLGPFDYENEVYTRSLWIAEGITSYYDDLLLRRAGLTTTTQYLEALSGQIGSLQNTPGRLVQRLDLASYDAWIKHYRRDENSPNTAISYYTKGAVVAFLLDAEVRRATNDQKSLDDVMRLAYDRYSGERGFTPAQFRATASEVAGRDLTPWFDHAVSSTKELEYESALDWFGLRFKDPDEKDSAKPGAESQGAEKNPEGKPDEEKEEEKEKEPDKGWLGLRTRADGGRLIVSQVRRETPAHRFGFNVGDEILAIDGYRIPAARWNQRRAQYRPGDDAVILIARREQLMEKNVTFAKEPAKKWKIAIQKEASDDQKARRNNWLGD